jgi:hypothetical protein
MAPVSRSRKVKVCLGYMPGEYFLYLKLKQSPVSSNLEGKVRDGERV